MSFFDLDAFVFGFVYTLIGCFVYQVTFEWTNLGRYSLLVALFWPVTVPFYAFIALGALGYHFVRSLRQKRVAR